MEESWWHLSRLFVIYNFIFNKFCDINPTITLVNFSFLFANCAERRNAVHLHGQISDNIDKKQS